MARKKNTKTKPTETTAKGLLQTELLLKALAGIHSSDQSSPGLVLSWLEDRKVFYGSIARYTKPFGRGKRVTFKATGTSLVEVVNSLAAQWLDMTSRVQELKRVTRRLPDSGVGSFGNVIDWDDEEEENDSY